MSKKYIENGDLKKDIKFIREKVHANDIRLVKIETKLEERKDFLTWMISIVAVGISIFATLR